MRLAITFLLLLPTAPVGAIDDSPAAILATMEKVADWQLAHPSRHPSWDWTQAAFYTGMTALMDVTDEPRFEDAMRRMAEANQWRPGLRPGHADDHAVIATYARLAETDRAWRNLDPARALFDYLAHYPYSESLVWGNDIETRELSWCDALFMGPPPLAAMTSVTGDAKYLDLGNRLWWKTTEYLYDREERLFFRDSNFFEPREKNGRKIFWSRGNGWVFSGLARMLQEVPENFPDRPRYVALFQEMAGRVAGVQGEDGYWRSSLLDPASRPNPETSGTGFFTHGLAWGLNRGLLERERFLPHVQKGWKALVAALHEDGKLGWVQRIGAAPGTTGVDETEVYGVGAFLLAGSEVLKLALLEGSTGMTVVASSDLDEARFDETLEVDWRTVRARLGGDPVFVFDGRSGRFLPSQLFDANGDGSPDQLLFQASFLAREKRTFEIRRLAKPWKRTFASRTFGRLVPERKDDFTWENDKIAFRMYGPALAATGEVSSGIDVWAKGVRRLVVDEWYRKGDYHVDHGEGLDFYKVGSTRGCGGIGILHGGDLLVSGNFRSAKVLATGPVRVAFSLSYDPWGPRGASLTEEKVISLDAGRNLNRIESRFLGATREPLEMAVGIAKRKTETGAEGDLLRDGKGRYLGLFEPSDAPHGRMACGIVFEGEGASVEDREGNHLLTTSHDARRPFVYRAGAAWSEGRDLRWTGEWEALLRREAVRLGSPLRVETR